jgi:hypothetical protein
MEEAAYSVAVPKILVFFRWDEGKASKTSEELVLHLR